MKEKQVSSTAIVAAYMRAYHAMHDDPKIFNDSLAYHLISEKTRLFLDNSMCDALKFYDPARAGLCPDQDTALVWAMRAMPSPAIIFGRSRYTEDILELAVSQGTRQYVILGAGFDTFALRRPDLLKQLQVFEIDHPVTQNFKRSRIAELGWEQPAQLHFLAMDFEQESLETVLTSSSYDPRALSFFSWLGVTHYLPRDLVFDMLRKITAVTPEGSTIVFDYLDADAFDPERAAGRMKVQMAATRYAGETMITGFDPSGLAGELEGLGLHVKEDLSPADIQERYFQGRTDGYRACEHTHYVWAVVK